MADYTQPDYVEKRLRYFDGQLLKDQDFVDEQKYFIDRQRRYNRFLNVSGIIHGLTLTTASDLVTVAPGAALDNRGRLVVLSDQVIETERQAPLRDYRGQTADLVISYKEDPDPPTGNAPRFREKPLLTVVRSGQSAPDGAIALARLTIDNAGVVTVNTSVRIYAGLRLPYDGAAPGAGPALRAGSINRMDLTGGLSVSGNVGIGTTTPNDKLHVVGGDMRVDNGTLWLRAGSDTNHGIGWYGVTKPFAGTTPDGPVVFGFIGGALGTTNGGQKLALSWNDSGNVGIGTTIPGAKLHVSGGIKIDGANTLEFGAGVSGKEGSAGKIGYQTFTADALDIVGAGTAGGNRKLQFWAEGGATFNGSLTISGNVSIGTSSALSFGSAVRQMINLWSTEYGIGVQNGTQYFRTGKNFAWYKGGAHNDGELNAGASGAVQMVINDGNVGIGITPPTKRLHVEAGELRVRASHNNTTADIGAFYAQNLTQGIGIGYNRIEAIGSNADQHILIIPKGTGNVGIGTTNPGAKLEVAGGAIMPAAGNSETAGIMFPKNPGGGGGDAAWIRYYAREGEKTTFEIGTSNDADDHMALMASGNVGIGTTSPGEKLDVNGSVKATKFIGEGAFVKGMVVMWSGALTQVPTGWALCDGGNGTPDLRRRFIVGAGSGGGQYGIGETGGLDQVTLSVAQMPSHNHNNGDWRWLLLVNGNNTTNSIDRSATEPNLVTPAEIQPAGGNQPHENRPPYYALAYIMKL